MYENFYFRKGYFRRQDGGNYIKRDGEYEEVPMGEGNYIWIRGRYIERKKKSHKEGA